MNNRFKKVVATLLTFALVFSLILQPTLVAAEANHKPYTIDFIQAAPGTMINAMLSTENEQFQSQLEAAEKVSLVGTFVMDNTESTYIAAQEILEQQYEVNGDFYLINWQLTIDDVIVEQLPSNTFITYSSHELFTGKNSSVLSISSDESVSILNHATPEDFMGLGILYTTQFSTSTLGSIVVIASDNLVDKSGVVTRTYSDGLLLFDVAVTGTVRDLPKDATVISTPYNDIEQYKALLAEKYTGQLNFSVYDYRLETEDGALEITDEMTTVIQMRFPAVTLAPYVFQVEDGELVKLKAKSIGSGKYEFETNGLKEVIILNADGLTEIIDNTVYTYNYSDINQMFSIKLVTKNKKLPQEATLELTLDDDQIQQNQLLATLSEKYKGNLAAVIYDAKIVSEGEEIAVPSDASIEVTAKTYLTTPYVFNYNDNKLVELNVINEGSGTLYDYTFIAKSLENLVFLNSQDVVVERFSDLAEGKYRVTANLFVDGPDNVVLTGVTAYLTNPELPPVTKMEQNATMIVDKYGYVTFEIDIRNPIFSLQELHDGEGVRIIDYVYGRDEGATDDAWGEYPGRIMHVTLTVDNLSGKYKFTEAKQYPTIIGEDKFMPISFGVEFNTATRLLDGEGERYTFTDEASGISVEVQSINPNVTEKLKEATLSVTEITEGANYDQAKAALITEFVDEPEYQLVEIKLNDSTGVEIEFTQTEAINIAFPLDENISKEEFVAYKNGVASKLIVSKDNGIARSEGNQSLGLYAVVNGDSIPIWVNTTTIDAATGIILKWFSKDRDVYFDTTREGIFAERTKGLAAMLASKNKYPERPDIAKELLVGTEHLELINPLINNVYQVSLSSTLFAGILDMMDESGMLSGGSWQIWIGKNDAFVDAIFPVSSNNSQFYIVTDDGSEKTVTKLDSTIQNGLATIELFPRSLGEEAGEARLYSLYWGLRSANAQNKKPISYIVEVTEEKVAIPTAISNLTYTGSLLTGVSAHEGYVLTGHQATEVGSYKATATLVAGYVWADGTTAPKDISWSIAEKSSSNTSVTKTVTANLYVPGSLNTQLPGINAYITNGSNPLGIDGYPKKAPTEPVSNNAQLTIDSDGKMTLVLDIPNPVFTLQSISGSSNAKIISSERNDTVYGKYTGRITQLTIELLDESGEYTFNNAKEYPTILAQDWFVPLTLHVNFNGGNSGLPVGNGDLEEGQFDGTLGLEDKEETITLENGTEYTKITKTDGSSTHAMVTKGGSTSNTVIEKNGHVTANIALSDQDLTAAKGTAIVLPIPTVKPSNQLDAAPQLKFTKLGNDDSTKALVTIPAEQVSTGTVVYEILADGTSQIVLDTKYNDGNITFLAETNTTYKFVNNTKAFEDATKENWYNDAVQYVASRGLMKGIDETSFSPNEPASRAMLSTILYRIAGEPAVTSNERSFLDVNPEAYYADAVQWASQANIVKGVNEGQFDPNGSLTREQLAVMLWRYAGEPAAELSKASYADAEEVSSFADQALAWALQKGIITGYGQQDLLNPKGKATRAELAQMLMRFIELN